MAEQTNYIGLYSQLINMGFDEECALTAAQKCKTVNKAIEWINRQNNSEIRNNKTEEKNAMEEMKCVHCECNGKDLRECIALQRLISILKQYNYSNQKNENLKPL